MDGSKNLVLIKRILRRVNIAISRRLGPVMIYGFRSADGQWRKGTRYSSTVTWQNPERVHMADLVYIGPYCVLDGSNGLYIGEGCQFSSGIVVTTHSSHVSIRLYGKDYSGAEMVGYRRGEVHVGAYSFIGPKAVIMPDTRIGKGSVVAAFSYVKGHFPDFAIIAGNPAKVVGDTRKTDAAFLEAHPELRTSYEAWAGPAGATLETRTE
jgi:acetyltransferase-like isoleucine patch superfamily enzyme